jgi:hypothetical protein
MNAFLHSLIAYAAAPGTPIHDQGAPIPGWSMILALGFGYTVWTGLLIVLVIGVVSVLTAAWYARDHLPPRDENTGTSVHSKPAES